MHRITTTCTILLALVPLPTTTRSEDRPLFRVGKVDYTLKDIAGVTEEQLRKRFNDETKNESIEQLLTHFDEKDHPRFLAIPVEKRGTALAEEFFKNTRKRLVWEAVNQIVLAGTTDNIIKEHNIDASEFFDLESMRTAIRQQILDIQLYYTDVDRKDRDESLLAQVHALGIKQDKAEWLEGRERQRKRHPISRWNRPLLLSAPTYEDTAIRSALAQALAEEACDKGIYNRLATELEIVYRSLYVELAIERYTGDKKVLDAFAKSITKDDGCIQGKGLTKLVEALRATSPTVAFDVSSGFGHDYAAQRVLPPIGRAEETKPGSYRIVGCTERFDPKSLTTAHDRDGFAMCVRIMAYRLAAADYLPEVTVLDPDIVVNRPYWLEQMRNDGLNAVAWGTRQGNYRKKPYPAEPFEVFRDARKQLQTLSVKAAAVIAGGDAKAAEPLRQEILELSRKPAPEIIQKRYRDLAEQLIQAFKLEPVPSKT